MANNTTQHTMTGFRPKLSARPPIKGSIAVLDRAYAEPTQVNSSPPFRSAVKVGRMVAIAVKSRALRRFVTTIALKDNQKALPRDVLAKSEVSFTVGVEAALSCGTLFACKVGAGRSTSELAMTRKQAGSKVREDGEGKDGKVTRSKLRQRATMISIIIVPSENSCHNHRYTGKRTNLLGSLSKEPYGLHPCVLKSALGLFATG